MIDKLNTYTSTGIKLINHPSVVRRIQSQAKGTLVVLQIAPESRCNLACSFCSNAKRNKHETLDIDRIKELISNLTFKGLKAIENTGGGEIALYPYINELIAYAKGLNLKIGMISNGILLKEKLSEESLNSLTWLRISMNCLDYVDTVDLPKIKGTLGFSYVMNEKTDENIFLRLRDYIDIYNPAYVRVVPDCQATDEEQEINNKNYSELISKWGEPFFYQAKQFKKPDNCYWCYFKPFLLHDGFIYPCSSVVLNDTADKQFHNRFRWCAMEELIEKYNEPMESFFNQECNHCVFSQQNNLITSILNPNGMEDFI